MNTIQTGSENLLDKLASSAQRYISKMQNEDDAAFASFLKDNFDSIDADKNSLLSKQEITTSITKENQNPAIQNILQNKNIESIISNIDANNDSLISKKEVDPDSNLGDIFKSAYKDLKNDVGLKNTALNLTNRVAQAYFLNDSFRSAATSAINLVL